MHPSVNGAFNLTWVAVDWAWRYELSNDGGTTWGKLGENSWEPATIHALSQSVDGTYAYQIRACNIAGCSSPVTGQVDVVLRPDRPSFLEVAEGTSVILDQGQTANIAWGGASGDVDYYEVYQQTDTGASNSSQWVKIYEGLGYSVDVTADTYATYRFRVRAVNTHPNHKSPDAHKVASFWKDETLFVVADEAKKSYQYDALGRLIKVHVNEVEKSDYDYDPAGNRTGVKDRD